MSEEFGPDFVTVVDDEGNEYELELLGLFDYKDDRYAAFLPAEMDTEEEAYGIILMKIIEEDGEEMFSTLDNDEELEEVYRYYMEELFDQELDDD